MLSFQSLGQNEARAALEVGLRLAREQGQVMAFAIADRSGEPIVCERMDGAAPRVLRHALRKAFTSAVMGRDTEAFGAQLKARSGDLTQWGDRRLTTLAGGCVVLLDGEVVGAIGCGGATGKIDMEIARSMADAAIAA